MRRRIESAIATAALCALLGVGSLSGAQPSKSSRNSAVANGSARTATDKAVLHLFEQVWDAEDRDVMRLGAETIRRAKRARADRADVEYAFGLVLMHHEAWRDAVDVLQRVIRAEPKFVPGYVALAECRLRSGKLKLSAAVLAEAVEQNPKDRLTVDAVASFVAFLTKEPLPGIKSDRLTELRDSLLAQLDETGQAEYQAAAERIDRYLVDLPKLRTELLEPLAMKRRQRNEIMEQASEIVERSGGFESNAVDLVERSQRERGIDDGGRSEKRREAQGVWQAFKATLTPAQRRD